MGPCIFRCFNCVIWSSPLSNRDHFWSKFPSKYEFSHPSQRLLSLIRVALEAVRLPWHGNRSQGALVYGVPGGSMSFRILQVRIRKVELCIHSMFVSFLLSLDRPWFSFSHSSRLFDDGWSMLGRRTWLGRDLELATCCSWSPREFEAKLQELWKSYGRATEELQELIEPDAERTIEPSRSCRIFF